MVESAWGAVPGLLPIRFARPLAEPCGCQKVVHCG